MLLKNKVAVIYGAGGAIGGAVARAFALEGAKLFLTGRHRAPLGVVAKEILSDGGSAEVAEVDALDEKAVDNHLQSVIDKAGHVDISFNAIDVPIKTIVTDAPLTEMDAEKFFLPIANYTRSYFLTARLAARRMVQNKSGVIMTVTALTSRKGHPGNGGYGSSQAAKEAYQPFWASPQHPHTVFLSADQGAGSVHPERRKPRARSRAPENLRTNTHPTDAAVASPVWPCLSMPKSSPPQSSRKPLSTSTSAAMIPQNHPLDSLKTRFSDGSERRFLVVWRKNFRLNSECYGRSEQSSGSDGEYCGVE